MLSDPLFIVAALAALDCIDELEANRRARYAGWETDAAKAMADALISGERKAVLLGNAAVQQDWSEF